WFAAFNREEESSKPGQFCRQLPKLVEREFFRRRDCILRKCAERASHIAPVRHLDQKMVRLPLQDGRAETDLSAQQIKSHDFPDHPGGEAPGWSLIEIPLREGIVLPSGPRHPSPTRILRRIRPTLQRRRR